MARSHRTTRFTRPQPRTKMWIGAGVGNTAIGASAKVLVSTLSAGALLLRPFTILRTHMELNIFSDQAIAIENNIASYGRIVVTSTAAAIGVTAVPDPSAISGDPEADWYLWSTLTNQFFIDINGTDGIGVDGSNGSRYLVDSKAMRKVGPDDQLVSVVSNDTAVGFSFVSQGRMLIQLH